MLFKNCVACEIKKRINVKFLSAILRKTLGQLRAIQSSSQGFMPLQLGLNESLIIPIARYKKKSCQLLTGVRFNEYHFTTIYEN